MFQLKSPVLLIVFNRPEPTRRVLDAIRQVRPSRLYIAGDGPRPDRPDDVARVEQVRALTAEVDWPCEVRTRFLDRNVGCKEGPAGAITWFFDQEPEGVILEDDILPSDKAFAYWDWGIETFRDQQDVFLIPAMSFFAIESTRPRRSRLVPCWGWGSWRRAWNHYDPMMASWPLKKHLVSRAHFGNAAEYVYRTYDRYDPINDDAWDIPWSWSVLAQGGTSILPPFPLIDNLGFGPDATHTKGTNRHGVASELYGHRELVHVVPDERIDVALDEQYLIKQYGADRLKRRLKSFIRKFVKPTPVG